ncbi:MAG: hypothetical protein RJA83_1275 [Pseudomonadota bacterium]|jgi:hypothetical protein
MLNIQQVTEAINHYRHNKGILKKIRRTEHPAISATETYLHSLQSNKTLLSNQDLFKINCFFLLDHPVKPGKASYAAWLAINYQNFCALNFGQITRLSQLLPDPVPIKYSGFATCRKAGYGEFPEHFSKLSLEQLDNKSNAEKMQEFFQVLSQGYQENTLTDDRFLALSKLCVEGMLTQEHINAIKSNVQANFLAKCLIKMKHTDTLTPENQAFILAYPGSIIIPVTHILIALDKTGLNTLTNRKILADFSYPIALHRTIKCLEKNGLLTQENFDLISAEHNLSWLLALEEMPEALITAEVWQGLLNLSENSNENDFRKDIQAYAEVLKKKLNVERMEKDILDSEEHIETQAISPRTQFFSVTPATVTPSTEEKVPKVNFSL